MPQAGDTLRFSIATINQGVLQSYADTGANKSWVYDSLVPIRQGVSEYLNSAQTPYPVNGKISEKLADTLTLQGFSLYDVYNFYSNSASEFVINQRGFTIPTGLSFPFPPTAKFSPAYTDNDEVYEFPLNYLDRDSNTFDFTFNNPFPAAYYSSRGYRINEVEAWGSITTPFGTFNCIKVKVDIVGYDTVSFGTLNFGQATHQREYQWLSPQLKIPVATLSGNVINGNFIPLNVQYRDSTRNLPGLLRPLALFNADTTSVRIGDSLQFNNFSISLIPAAYNWSISPNTFSYVSGSSATSIEPLVVFNDTGKYDVQLIVNNGSGIDTLLLTDYIEVKQAVSVVEYKKVSISDLKIFPNPIRANSRVHLISKFNLKRIRLLDLNLRQVKEWNGILGGETYLNIESIVPATYFLIIDTGKEELVKKLIVQ